MKAKKFTPPMRGLAALMTCLMVLSIVGTGVANTYRGALDDTLGTESYVTINDDSAAHFKTDYATIEDMAAAARDIAIREGEEGTVVMKNDNGVLPLKANANVALFGLAAYNVYGPKGGNADAASLADALAFTLRQQPRQYHCHHPPKGQCIFRCAIFKLTNTLIGATTIRSIPYIAPAPQRLPGNINRLSKMNFIVNETKKINPICPHKAARALSVRL